MGARGRQAGNLLSVVPQGDIISIPRPKEPDYFTPEQSQVWNQIVSSYPADYFEVGALPLLAELCQATVTQKKLTLLINPFELRITQGKSVDSVYFQLIRTKNDNGSKISSHATRLRLTPHSNYAKDKKRKTISSKPWESDTEEA